MCYYQYRITVNESQGPIVDKCPSEQWAKIAERWDFRGGIRALLERRLITDTDILPLLGGKPDGYIVLGEMVICPWENFGQLLD